MIRRAEAIRYDGIVAAEAGRNQPLMVTVEDADGEEIEVFLKPSGRPELGIEGLANELLAACIAGQMGLPVCEPLLVEMTPDWIATVPHPELREVLGRSSPIAFGSRSAGQGWKAWAAKDHVLGDRRSAATAIFVFDALTLNADRGPGKPNILVKGDAFRMIDHEMCFRVRMQLFPPPRPWDIGNLQSLIQPNGHIFGQLLKGDRFVDVGAVRPSWLELSDECLADYEATQPGQWHAAAGPIEAAIAHLRTVRDRIDECLQEVQRVLQ